MPACYGVFTPSPITLIQLGWNHSQNAWQEFAGEKIDPSSVTVAEGHAFTRIALDLHGQS
jgi:hypothetical protein